MKFLIDASFIAKAILKEDGKVESRLKELLNKSRDGKIELFSSKLITLEVANALRFAIKDSEKSTLLFKDFLALPIKTLVLTKQQLKSSISLSYELNTTVYDTSYHVLAKAQNAIFLTCDEDYYKKAKVLGDIELIK